MGTRGTRPEPASDAEGTRARGERGSEGRPALTYHGTTSVCELPRPPRERRALVPIPRGRVALDSLGARHLVPSLVPSAFLLPER